MTANSYSVATDSHNNNKSDNEDGAGSGTLASPSQSEIREGNISNPRVLSDMGLAIPRPTRLPLALARLGDPRSGLGFVPEILISLLTLSPCPKGHEAGGSTSNLLV